MDYPQSLTNADIMGQGNLDLVREKSGKCQGILLSIICGNPAFDKGYRGVEGYYTIINRVKRLQLLCANLISIFEFSPINRFHSGYRLQKVKTQIRCCKRLHFIRIFSVC